MKSETKELVEWCISLLKVYRGLNINEKKNIMAAMPDKEIDNCERSIKFLESLPEIESHLCRGGYIQDKNGTPCCEDDKILFCGEHYGFLRFGFMDGEDKKYNCLPHFWFDFGGNLPTINSNSVYFEKVE